MAEQKNNKGFGALDDLSSDIDEKSSNTKPQTAVKKTTAPKVKKSFPPVRKKNVKAIKKSPAIKRKQSTVRNKRIKIDSPSQKKNFNKPFFSPEEIKYLWIALFIILLIFLNKDDSKNYENSNNIEETSIGTTYNYSEKKANDYYSIPSEEARKIVTQGWENMSKKSSVDNPDYELAFELNLKGFNLGHPEGATNLGNLYELGLGIPKNLDYAFSWYKQAIERGAYHSADAELGVIRTTIKLKLDSGSNFSQSDIDELLNYVILAKKKTTEFNLWSASDNARFISEANRLKKDIEHLAPESNKLIINDKSSKSVETENIPEEPEKILEQSTSFPHGFVSLYTDRKTYGVFGWSAGYKTQDEANQAAYDICMKRGAKNTCEYLHGSYARCVAIAENPKWIQSGVGNTKKEAEEQALSLCEKKGLSCVIPNDGSGCSR